MANALKPQDDETATQKDSLFLTLAEKLYRPGYASYTREKERMESAWEPNKINLAHVVPDRASREND